MASFRTNNSANNIDEIANEFDHIVLSPTTNSEQAQHQHQLRFNANGIGVGANCNAGDSFYFSPGADQDADMDTQRDEAEDAYGADDQQCRIVTMEHSGFTTGAAHPPHHRNQQQQQQQQLNADVTSDTQADLSMGARYDERADDDGNQENRRRMSNILIVTNLDPSVFVDNLFKSKFESLFITYDPNVTFRYLKSFKRVRIDFTTSKQADLARRNLNKYKLGACEFRCFMAQMIKPPVHQYKACDDQSADDSSLENNSFYNNTQYQASPYLSIPKPTKQFLISPPASPPVGWEPVNESSPCLDSMQLISAIANLVPGTVQELHPGTESQPGIFVEVCEEPKFDNFSSMRSCNRIPKTSAPMRPM